MSIGAPSPGGGASPPGGRPREPRPTSRPNLVPPAPFSERSCKDCLSTNWGCNWCLNENVCLFNTSRCEKTGQQVAGRHQLDSAGPLVQLVAGSGGRQSAGTGPILVSTGANPQRSSTVITTGAAAQPRVGNTISQVQQCPTFDVGHQQDILIADGSEKELSIRVKNMPQFKVSTRAPREGRALSRLGVD